MHRVIAVAAAAALVFGFALLPATPAVAAPALPCASGTPIPGDYDGDGGADLLVNFIDASRPVEGQPDVTNLITPSDGGAAYRLDVPDGRNGSPVVNADLNGDLCSDVIIVTLHKVLVVLGGHNGINMASANSLALPESAEPGSLGLFHAAVGLRHDGISQIVVAGHRDYDHSLAQVVFEPVLETFTLDSTGNTGAPVLTDLDAHGVGWRVTLTGSGATVAVGAPTAKVGKKHNAGAVVILTASPAGALTYRAKITQNSPRVPGTAETGDGFGQSVSLRDGRLAIGVSGESIGRADTGMVQPIRWNEDTATYTAYRSIHQNTRGVAGSNKDGDAFSYVVLVTRGLTAAGSYDIAIATPNKKVGRASWAGSVTVANFTKAIYRTYTQNTKGVPGTAETGDGFGTALGVLHTSPAVETLLIGAPGERSGTAHTGYVTRSDGKKLTSSHWVSVVAPTADYRLWGNNFAG